jgi:aerobic carbon-monoxide dehydrogenase large subunit
MSILGNRVPRVEDPRLLTVGGTYVDDLPLEGALHVTYVRSTMAHARILSIDVDEATAAPGVVAVFTAADLDIGPFPASMPMLNQQMLRPLLATDVVRFVGEPVAAVVSEERAQGVDAAEMVIVDYDPLPVVVDAEAAASTDLLLFPEAGTNDALVFDLGSDPQLFDGCEVVVRQRIVNQRLAPCPMEPRASAAAWGDDGRVTVWVSSQGPHANKASVAATLGIDDSLVRAISPDVGGGFGAKAGAYTEELLLPWIARRVERPVRWVETRTESMLTLGHGRGQVQQVEIGGRRDGTIEAYRLKVVADAGAYPLVGAVLPFLTRVMLTGVYNIPKAEFAAVSRVTNTTPTVAYRGAGRPEATAAIERAVDIFADEIGMDPAEVRRRNLIAADAFPFTTPTGTEYDTGDYEKALDLALDAAGYASLLEEQERRRASGDVKQMGIGLSVYVEITNPVSGAEFGAVEVTTDGKAIVRAGTFSHGQGHATAFAMIVSQRLGIPIDDITFLQGDTDTIPYGEGTGGSRSLQHGGAAVARATTDVLDQARQLAADLLEANVDDIVVDQGGGGLHVAGSPTAIRSWGELATAAAARGGEGKLAAELKLESPGSTFPFGAHVAVVEVDTETGQVQLARMITCDDSGTILNPLIVEGQRHGGIAQGVAQALIEEVRYDEDGNPVTANLADYGMISATELPFFELVTMETPTPKNELGAKGIGESGTIGSTPAVQNAVVDALSHLGVRHVEMPTTAERVWRAIQDAKG